MRWLGHCSGLRGPDLFKTTCFCEKVGGWNSQAGVQPECVWEGPHRSIDRHLRRGRAHRGFRSKAFLALILQKIHGRESGVSSKQCDGLNSHSGDNADQLGAKKIMCWIFHVRLGPVLKPGSQTSASPFILVERHVGSTESCLRCTSRCVNVSAFGFIGRTNSSGRGSAW